jgi:hypothetical protein
MAALPAYDLLEDWYFPFRLYSDFKQGERIEGLARKYSVGVLWAQERIEAPRLCIEKQVTSDSGRQHG